MTASPVSVWSKLSSQFKNWAPIDHKWQWHVQHKDSANQNECNNYIMLLPPHFIISYHHWNRIGFYRIYANRKCFYFYLIYVMSSYTMPFFCYMTWNILMLILLFIIIHYIVRQSQNVLFDSVLTVFDKCIKYNLMNK